MYIDDDGILLSAVLEKAEKPEGAERRPLVILLHGFTSSKDRPHNLLAAAAMREAGCDTYDSLALLIATEGRSSLDDFRLREVTERADDGASRGADAGAGASASAGTDAGTSALGASFAQARKARGISQSRLAHETGLQQAAISRFEHGQANPTIETLQVLAAGIGMKLAIGFE